MTDFRNAPGQWFRVASPGVLDGEECLYVKKYDGGVLICTESLGVDAVALTWAGRKATRNSVRSIRVEFHKVPVDALTKNPERVCCNCNQG